MPVYKVSTVYKNKTYSTLINGQTGQVGYLPLSPWKIILNVASIIFIVLLLILIVVFTTHKG